MEKHTVRCKFICNAVKTTLQREYTSWETVEGKSVETKHPARNVYQAEFSCVTGESPENKKFFQWTPSGRLEIGVYRENVFEVGKEYYLDVTQAE